MSDAWKQMDELVEKYTEEWTVRRDLKVRAEACDRQVRLGIPRTGGPTPYGSFVSWLTPRNVGTMREFAEAILKACAFVEAANPGWASHRDAE